MELGPVNQLAEGEALLMFTLVEWCDQAPNRVNANEESSGEQQYSVAEAAKAQFYAHGESVLERVLKGHGFSRAANIVFATRLWPLKDGSNGNRTPLPRYFT